MVRRLEGRVEVGTTICRLCGHPAPSPTHFTEGGQPIGRRPEYHAPCKYIRNCLDVVLTNLHDVDFTPAAAQRLRGDLFAAANAIPQPPREAYRIKGRFARRPG